MPESGLPLSFASSDEASAVSHAVVQAPQ